MRPKITGILLGLCLASPNAWRQENRRLATVVAARATIEGQNTVIASPDKEKAEEGTYGLLQNGGLVPGSMHSWVLWRLSDGRYELQDHLESSDALASVSAHLAKDGTQVSREARKVMEESTFPSDLTAVLGTDYRLLSLTVTGKNATGAGRESLKCLSNPKDIKCTGVKGKAEFHLQEPRALFWWYRMPVFLETWFASTATPSPDSRAFKIAMLSFAFGPGIQVVLGENETWGDRPQLDSADLMITSLGLDTLVVGNRQFHVQKHRLEFKVEHKAPFVLTTWTDARGRILAVENASKPGELVALVQYKSYSNPPPAIPAPTEK